MLSRRGWRQRSLPLRRALTPGFSFIGEPHPLPADVGYELVNHGGLALLHRINIRVVKKDFKAIVTTFEYLCGYVTVENRHFVILGVYRPGSETVTSHFFNEFTKVLVVLSTYRCPIILCGDFYVHLCTLDMLVNRLTQRVTH